MLFTAGFTTNIVKATSLKILPYYIVCPSYRDTAREYPQGECLPFIESVFEKVQSPDFFLSYFFPLTPFVCSPKMWRELEQLHLELDWTGVDSNQNLFPLQ